MVRSWPATTSDMEELLRSKNPRFLEGGSAKKRVMDSDTNSKHFGC